MLDDYNGDILLMYCLSCMLRFGHNCVVLPLLLTIALGYSSHIHWRILHLSRAVLHAYKFADWWNLESST